MDRVRRLLRRTAVGVVWLAVASLAAVLVATVAVPRLAGATTYTVLSGSMRPALPPGTLVVVRPAPARAIGLGDVVTYQVHSGRPEVVTHRVVARTVDAGEVRLKTRGDANETEDAAWVRPVQLRGTVWYSVPHVGRVGALLDPGTRALLVRGAAVALLGYAAALLALEARDRAGVGRRLRHG